jgi:predicted ATP-grasp superfamily ATP-dependent carboligase
MLEVEDTGSGGVGPVVVVAENPFVIDVRLTTSLPAISLQLPGYVATVVIIITN